MPTSQAIGSAGELIVQARLMMRGWLVGNVNSGGMRNAPAVDLMAAKGKHMVRIAVKTTGPGNSNVQWSAKFEWKSLFKGVTPPHFVIFVWFHKKDSLDDCRIFVVPAKIVDREVKKANLHWHSGSKRDGSKRKESNHVAIKWLGQDTPGNIAYGFAEKWRKYENAWKQLG